MGDRPSSSSSQLLLLALQERLQSHMRNDSSLLLQHMLLGINSSLVSSPSSFDVPSTSTTPSHPLWQHQLCGWPGCDQPIDSFNSFLNHLSTVHPLDERSALQIRQQIDLVDSLEHRSVPSSPPPSLVIMYFLCPIPPLSSSFLVHLQRAVPNRDPSVYIDRTFVID